MLAGQIEHNFLLILFTIRDLQLQDKVRHAQAKNFDLAKKFKLFFKLCCILP